MAVNKKREGYLDWDEYFMAMATVASERSKDPKFQVGACIVNNNNKIVGIGYNGFPVGCNDDLFPWGKNEEDNKLLYVCHAELNAIAYKNITDLKDCTMYVSLFPCNQCAKLIIQSGIKRVWYVSDKNAHTPQVLASKRMLDAADVKYRQMTQKNTIEIKTYTKF